MMKLLNIYSLTVLWHKVFSFLGQNN